MPRDATFTGCAVSIRFYPVSSRDDVCEDDQPDEQGRHRGPAATERVLFGLVANRALAPSSKLAAAEWISNDVHIENLPGIGEQACYRAMDWLHDARASLEAGVFDTVATVLNLEVDLLFL